MVLAEKEAGMRKHRVLKMTGFTMIELLVALGIVGLIAALAIPSYQQSIRKSNRADAQITLSQLATLQEQFFFRTNNYTDDFADLVDGAVSGANLPSNEGHYSISLTVSGGGTGWNMIATPQGDQLNDDECLAINLNSLGAKTASDSNGVASTVCW